MFPQLARFTDLGLLLLRLMTGMVFISSGWADVKDPEARSKSIGLSRGLTVLLGIAELACGLGVASGVLTQLAAIGLILIMLGASIAKYSCGTPDSGVRRPQAGITI